MQYNSYSYLWPARPETAVPVNFLSFYEKRKWVGQYKKNGTCNVLFVDPNKEISVQTRHNTSHKLWAPTAASNAPFKALPGNGWYVILTEVLHSKVPGIKDTHYIFDIMVSDGEYLTNMTFADRALLLKKLFMHDKVTEEYSHYNISDRVQLAKLITSNFTTIWNDINNIAQQNDSAPLDEGLVLKNPNAKLVMPTKRNSNNKWMVKCRVKHKNYTF